ncbi:MAG: bifunctional DNA primase/polymerase [Chloroflexi bacterium]|nr:bifunctional DNA primase/polymerase [Chloroflexota bacterium]
MTDFYLAALSYFQSGYMTMPLTLDNQSLPKKPIVNDWTSLPRSLETIKALPWHGAKGIGIILGPTSHNLAAIDIDDTEMADRAIQLCPHTQIVKTVRNHCHIYIHEQVPSRSTNLTVLWLGRHVKIELKAQGCQVAAPPTPGYSLISEKPPQKVETIEAAWEGLAYALGAETANMERYPSPWRPRVPVGERNKSAYIEAHMLRGSQMPLDMALEYMRIRWSADYDKDGEQWEEIKRTVESAYRKGIHSPLHEVYEDIQWN